MRATKFIFVTFWLIILINASDSHNEHDEHDYHNDGEDHIEQHVHEHKLSSNQRLSQIIQDLEAYCHTKITDDSSNSSTNITLQRKDDNFTSSICRSILDVGDSKPRTSTPSKVNQKFITPSTWGYAILACVIISLVGLLAVAIIPLMHRVIYNHLLQFLVSLAIGSLAGDALLHLIPHALVPHEHDHHQHHEHEFHDLGQQVHDPHHHRGHDRRPVWLGLMALGGLFMFFIVERLVGYCSEMKRKRNKGEKYQNNNPEPETSVCLKTSDVNTTNGMMMMVDAGGDRKEMAGRVVPQSNGSASCEEMLMVVHASKDIKKMAHDAHEEVHKNCDPPASADHMVHQRGGHHHHSHEVPGSVAAVAWMVIVGDGFHNFADGIAIGSAFASSIQDGLSTAIAIFCHELPHELGDFAMLLSAGMSGKQALVYNCVSSILCLVGMCVGVGVSNLVSATPWIFMTIAGMFIYIALVDMLPEMKSVDPKRGEHPLLHLGLQVMGMLTGSSIMLIIALFEHQITIPM